jgi:chorismate lyase/3-hydroxybenzoate synthase
MLHVHHALRDTTQKGQTLAEFHFGTSARPTGDPRHIPVTLAQLGGDERIERWSTDSPVTAGRYREFAYAEDGDYLFASLRVPPGKCADIERVTRSSYLHLDHLIRRLGYPYWLRAWNYLADITTGEGESERYRRFNAGRYSAVGLSSGIEQNLPAASALGMDPGMDDGGESGGFVLCCLAGKKPGAQIENPRQLSASLYPPRYGLRSPMFARAALVPNGKGAQLLVSGTASIVGHESLHIGDPERQLEETSRNFEALVDAAMRADVGRPKASSVRLESLKVYLRNSADYARLIPRIRRLFAVEHEPLVLRADICRRELLIEIEGTYALE